MDQTPQIAAFVNETLASESDKAERIIQGAITLSSSEVATVGERIAELGKNSKAHTESLSQLNATLTGCFGAERERLEQLSNGQRQTITELKQQARAQHDVARRALGLTENIGKLSGEVQNVASEARLLAINAQIESAHLGEAGKPFSVIAEHMKELSLQTRTANESVASLASNLAELLPTMFSSAEHMMQALESFAELFSQQITEFRGLQDEGHRATEGALDEARRQATALRDTCYEMLSCLQFQDRMTQDLRQACNVLNRNKAVVQTFFEGLAGGTDVGTVAQAAKNAVPVVSETLGGDAAGTQAAGEVVLF